MLIWCTNHMLFHIFASLMFLQWIPQAHESYAISYVCCIPGVNWMRESYVISYVCFTYGCFWLPPGWSLGPPPKKIPKMGGCPKHIILLTNLLTKLFIFDRQCGGVRSADLFVDSCRDGALRCPWHVLLLAGVAFGAPGLSLDVICDPQGCPWPLLAAPGICLQI